MIAPDPNWIRLLEQSHQDSLEEAWQENADRYMEHNSTWIAPSLTSPQYALRRVSKVPPASSSLPAGGTNPLGKAA